MEGSTRLIDGLVKQTRYSVNFVILCSQSDSFQPPQTFQFLNRFLCRSAATVIKLGMTEKVLSQVQVTEIGFLRKVQGMTFHGNVRSCKTNCNTLNIEPLLLWIKRSQLQCSGQLTKIPEERLDEASPANYTRGRPRAKWRDYISELAWSRRGVNPAELSEIVENREVFPFLQRVLPLPRPFREEKLGVKMNEWDAIRRACHDHMT